MEMCLRKSRLPSINYSKVRLIQKKIAEICCIMKAHPSICWMMHTMLSSLPYIPSLTVKCLCSGKQLVLHALAKLLKREATLRIKHHVGKDKTNP